MKKIWWIGSDWIAKKYVFIFSISRRHHLITFMIFLLLGENMSLNDLKMSVNIRFRIEVEFIHLSLSFIAWLLLYFQIYAYIIFFYITRERDLISLSAILSTTKLPHTSTVLVA